ncbi:MAG: FHA domain-containing protein, partial [Planctomycetota bacterium]|nr:FHA domain-containing protein [Planctomycetota bacterium]
RIMKDGAQWYAIDRDSRNGTFVNGEQISKHTLKEGDHIKVGFSIMQFNLVGSPEPAKPPKAPEPDLVEEAPPPPKKKKKKPSKRAKEKPAASPEAKTATRRRAKPKPAPAAKPDGEITCDLCSRVLSRDDLESGLAVASQDKFYCLTCVRKLGNLASGVTKPSVSTETKDSLDDEDIDLLLKEDVQAEDEELFP